MNCYSCGETLCYFTMFSDWRLSNNSWHKLRISPTIMGWIISENCQILWTVLSEKGFIEAPDSEEEKWLTVAAEFNGKWNFPHCLGAINGKHVFIQAPARSGSNFFTYKKCFSIVLLAVCNANYGFTLVELVRQGGIVKVTYTAVVIWVRQLTKIYWNFPKQLPLTIIALQRNSLMFLLLTKHLLYTLSCYKHSRGIDFVHLEGQLLQKLKIPSTS